MDSADLKNDIAFRKIFGNEEPAFIEADKYHWKKEEIIAYDNANIKETDAKQEKILVAEKAREAGRDEKEAETVIKLHNKGKTDIEIADLLDMPLEKVQQIIKNYTE